MTHDIKDLEQRVAMALRVAAAADARVQSQEERHARTRRRERWIAAGLLLLVVCSATSWPVGAQPTATVESRMADLESRVKRLESLIRVGKGNATQISGPFEVVDAKGTVLSMLRDANGLPVLTVGNSSAGAAQLGVGRSGAGFMVVTTATGGNGVTIGSFRGAGMGVDVHGADGSSVEAFLGLDAQSKGQLRVGASTRGGVDVVVGRSGTGAVAVRRGTGKYGVTLGQFEGRPMGVTVLTESEKDAVSLSTDEKGGTVRVMNASGAAVAGLLGNDTGGGLALTGASGGRSAISLGVEATGGKVRVYPAGGGRAQAELSADAAGGGVTVYTNSGVPAATMYARSTGAGQLEINQNGQKLVEAGVNANGIGVVLAGPGGAAANAPGAPGSYIIGRRVK